MNSFRSIAKHPTISLVDSYTTLKELKQIHTQLLVRGLLNDPHLLCQFIATIALKNPTNIDYSNHLLDQCFNPTLFTLDSMMRKYSESAIPLKGFHSIYQSISEPDLVCQTTMVCACAKWGDLDFARKLFNKLPQRDSILWNAMISGYSQRGKYGKALNLFSKMQMEGVKVNEVSMVSVLSACSHLGALDQGIWAHAYIERSRIRVTVTLGTALVDMYAKCGDVNKAIEVFWSLKEKNVYTWNSAIGGLVMNGCGKKCRQLFSRMKHDGILPDEVTFTSVLRGCSMDGLVNQGHRHFESMKKVYGIEPQVEHYGYMVDLYSRAGRLDEALSFINNMPMKPHAGAWSALLTGCRKYKNDEMGEIASGKIVELMFSLGC